MRQPAARRRIPQEARSRSRSAKGRKDEEAPTAEAVEPLSGSSAVLPVCFAGIEPRPEMPRMVWVKRSDRLSNMDQVVSVTRAPNYSELRPSMLAIIPARQAHSSFYIAQLKLLYLTTVAFGPALL